MKTEFDKSHRAHKHIKFTLGPIGLMLLLKTGWGRSVGAITPNRCRPWISTINELMLQLKPTLACSNTAHSGSLMVILEEGGDTLMSQSGAVMETNKREAQKKSTKSASHQKQRMFVDEPTQSVSRTAEFE